MQNFRFNSILNIIKYIPKDHRSVHTTCCLAYDVKWREENRLPLNPTEFGHLTNAPDYTFMDGRPTPLGSRQKKRLLKQREMAKRIITLSKEIDNAKVLYQNKLKEIEREKLEIIQSKLKPKGHLLLAKK